MTSTNSEGRKSSDLGDTGLYECSKSSKRQKENIFSIKKRKRNGLLEKKKIILGGKINTGRWSQDEHNRFMKACLEYGAQWGNIQRAVMTRTTAQIRSHAQKYVIKLCKKYNIEIRSRRRVRFVSEHLNYPYKRKSQSIMIPIERMSEDDKKFIQEFNFYEKTIDFQKIEDYQRRRKKDIFFVGKFEEIDKSKKSSFSKYKSIQNILSEINSNKKAKEDLPYYEDKIFELQQAEKAEALILQPQKESPNPALDTMNIDKSPINNNNYHELARNDSLFKDECSDFQHKENKKKFLQMLEKNVSINKAILGILIQPISSDENSLTNLKEMIMFIKNQF